MTQAVCTGYVFIVTRCGRKDEMKTHYFWCLCPDDIEQGGNFTMEPEEVTCESCKAEMNEVSPAAVTEG